MKVLVCGGRNYRDQKHVDDVLQSIHDTKGIEVVIHGCALGADACADFWASKAGVRIRRFPANWIAHGKSAGYIRNQEMLANGRPDCVIAFPGGAGTRNMVELAKKADIEVIIAADWRKP